MDKYFLNGSTLIWNHEVRPDERPPLKITKPETKVTLSTEDSVNIPGEMRIKSDYFSLSSPSAIENCTRLLEEDLGLKDPDPRSRGRDDLDEWAIRVMAEYAERYGIVYDLHLWGHCDLLEDGAMKKPPPFQSWWMGYFDNPTLVDPSMGPERLMALVESCLETTIANRPEIAGVFIGSLHAEGGPGWLMRHRRATRIVEDPEAFKWANSLDLKKEKIFTNDPEARYLFDKKRRESGLECAFPITEEDDLLVALQKEIDLPENLKIERMIRHYTNEPRPHPYTIGRRHLESSGMYIDSSLPCAACGRPVSEHTYDLVLVVSIDGSIEKALLRDTFRAIENKTKSIDTEITINGFALMDAATGRGADIKKQIIGD